MAQSELSGEEGESRARGAVGDVGGGGVVCCARACAQGEEERGVGTEWTHLERKHNDSLANYTSWKSRLALWCNRIPAIDILSRSFARSLMLARASVLFSAFFFLFSLYYRSRDSKPRNLRVRHGGICPACVSADAISVEWTFGFRVFFSLLRLLSFRAAVVCLWRAAILIINGYVGFLLWNCIFLLFIMFLHGFVFGIVEAFFL